jgi:hypothetical protein
MLNESKAPKTILSEGLKHHIDNNKPLTEHLYRAGSSAYFNLMAEARSLYSRGILEFTNEDDLGLLNETDLGHFGMFEGKKVPLDFPIELNEQMDIYDDVANMEFGMDYDQLGSNEKEWVRDEIDNMEMREAYSGFIRNPEDPDSEKFEPTGAVSEFKEELRALFGKFKGDLRNPEFIKGVAQIMNNWKPLLRSQLNENFEMGDRVKLTPDYEETPGEVFTITQISGNKYFIADEDGRGWYTYGGQLVMADDEYINEAKKKKAKKKDNRPIGKPMRSSSGGKAYKVYVKDPKTKKVKTVRFGSGGLRAKINDSKARKAFAARHKCSQKKDRTKASYWSCRLPRYAKLLGLKSSFSGFW